MRVVAKIGTSSITDQLGVIDTAFIDTMCDQLAALRAAGHEVVLVSSGAVSAGVSALDSDLDRKKKSPSIEAKRPSGSRRQQVQPAFGPSVVCR